MIPGKFDYVRPDTVDGAVRALTEAGDEAKVIAGGQSLLPLLRLRLAYPEVLVDVGGIDGLRGVSDSGDSLVIGARTTHYQLVHDPLVAEHAGLLDLTRNRGETHPLPAGTRPAGGRPRGPAGRGHQHGGRPGGPAPRHAG